MAKKKKVIKKKSAKKKTRKKKAARQAGGRGSKASYSPKQRRMARHIEKSEQKEGRSPKAAARIAWATVNKQTGGARGSTASRSRSGSPSSREARSQNHPASHT